MVAKRQLPLTSVAADRFGPSRRSPAIATNIRLIRMDWLQRYLLLSPLELQTTGLSAALEPVTIRAIRRAATGSLVWRRMIGVAMPLAATVSLALALMPSTLAHLAASSTSTSGTCTTSSAA